MIFGNLIVIIKKLSAYSKGGEQWLDEDRWHISKLTGCQKTE